jgi:tetratricopeptide (TPR) repeat protein
MIGDSASMDAIRKEPEDGVARLERVVHGLCCEYSTTPPARLVWPAQKVRQAADTLFECRLSPSDARRLTVAASWLHLLLTCLLNDLGWRGAAWAHRDAALRLGREARDANLVAWSFETPSWFALYDDRPQTALDYALEGLKEAPAGSSGLIMLRLKAASAWARMGRRTEAERELEAAAGALHSVPAPEHPQHHFVFDPPKFDSFAATAYVWLGLRERAQEHARAVIRRQDDPEALTYNPSRLATARLDLGQVLLELGRLDEAFAESCRAFDTFPRRDTLVRARELDAEFQSRHPREPEAREFHDRYVEALRSIPNRRG